MEGNASKEVGGLVERINDRWENEMRGKLGEVINGVMKLSDVG